MKYRSVSSADTAQCSFRVHPVPQFSPLTSRLNDSPPSLVLEPHTAADPHTAAFPATVADPHTAAAPHRLVVEPHTAAAPLTNTLLPHTAAALKTLFEPHTAAAPDIGLEPAIVTVFVAGLKAATGDAAELPDGTVTLLVSAPQMSRCPAPTVKMSYWLVYVAPVAGSVAVL